MVKQKTEIRKQVLAARLGLGREEVIRSSRIILEKAEKYLDLADGSVSLCVLPERSGHYEINKGLPVTEAKNCFTACL